MMQANGEHQNNNDLMDIEANPDNALEYMKAFTSAQATRTEIHHEFESAINDYANGIISIEEIQQVIRISQEGFQDVSSDIVRQERLLNLIGQTNLSNIIRQVQNLEKENLEVTVKLLSSRLQAAQRPEISYQAETEDFTRRQQLIEAINEVMEEARAEMLDI
ncbi:uncharacterized protein V1513DRAFT_447400 [Lipomyces chichibuensis]|uniref:uncharacterized protein n=1 Tax=Lipomyces chichibuensis TaxID=1546026 RepID=UPI003343E670